MTTFFSFLLPKMYLLFLIFYDRSEAMVEEVGAG